jgi:hypothetical protein
MTLQDLPRLDALYHRLEAYRTRYWDTNFPVLVARLKEVGHAAFQIPRKPSHDKDYWRTFDYSCAKDSGGKDFETYALGLDTEGPDRHPDLARAIHHFECRRMQQLEVSHKLRARIMGILDEASERRGTARDLCVEVNGRRYIVGGWVCKMFGARIDEDVVKL